MTLEQSKHTCRHVLRKIYPKVLSLLENVCFFFFKFRSAIFSEKVIEFISLAFELSIPEQCKDACKLQGYSQFSSMRDISQKDAGILKEGWNAIFNAD